MPWTVKLKLLRIYRIARYTRACLKPTPSLVIECTAPNTRVQVEKRYCYTNVCNTVISSSFEQDRKLSSQVGTLRSVVLLLSKELNLAPAPQHESSG